MHFVQAPKQGKQHVVFAMWKEKAQEAETRGRSSENDSKLLAFARSLATD